MAYIWQPKVVKPVPKSATLGTVGGRRVARWTSRKGRAVVAPLTADGTRCEVKSPTWWIEYPGPAKKKVRRKGFASREATFQLAAELERTARAVRTGAEPPPPKAGPKVLADYLPGYRAHVAARCQNEKHVYEAVEYVRQVLVGAALTTPAAVDCGQVAGWLGGERTDRGWSQRTFNHRVTKLKAFGNWLMRKQGLKFNPFAGLEGANAEHDRRHVRRALDHFELLLLVAAARSDPEPYAMIPGPDRAALYLFAAYTGFRISALARLTPEAVEWADGLPFRVFGRRQKSGKPHGVPFHAEVAADLAGWLTVRPPGRPLWSGWKRWNQYGARVLRHDLGRARAAYLDAAAADPAELARRRQSDVLLYRDAAGEVFDFHSLRVQFISTLARSGVSEMAARELAGHSDPKLTSVVYARWGKGGALAAEIAKLPGLKPVG